MMADRILSSNFEAAVVANAPLEPPSEPNKAPDSIFRDTFEDAAKPNPNSGNRGRTPAPPVTDTPVGLDFGFKDFWYLLTLLFTDYEKFSWTIDWFFPEGSNQERRDQFVAVARDPNHPDRNISRDDFIAKYFPGDNTHLNALMFEIVARESGGQDNIIYNYKGGPGLKPGDVTAGGLIVPDITKLTVNEVIAWQQDYLNEQYTIGGIERGKGSSAAGLFQFVSKTLEEMRDNEHISGDTVFTRNVQIQLALKRLETARGLDEFMKGNKTVKEFIEDIRNEWEGAKHIPDAKLTELVTAMISSAPPRPGA